MERLKATEDFWPELENSDLHSSMERLKAPAFYFPTEACPYLHSSMERLKAVLPARLGRVWVIYIPVWRD